MRIGELLYTLGFESDNTKLNEFLKMVGDLNMSSILAGTAMGSLFETSKKFLDNAKDAAMNMLTFQNVTGRSAQEMMAWSNAADQAGVRSGALQSSVEALQQSIYNTKKGNLDMGLAQAYSILRTYGQSTIDINDDILVQYEKVREALKHLSPAAQRDVLAGMHIDESMLNLFKAPSEIWAKRMDMHNIMSPDDVQRMAEMNAKWKELGQELGAIGNKFATEISPSIIGTTRTLINLLKEVKESWIGKTLSMSAEGWGRIGEYAQLGLDNATDWIAKQMAGEYHIDPRFHSPTTSQGHQVSIVSNQYINGDDVGAMKQAAKDAQKEAISEAFHGTQKVEY